MKNNRNALTPWVMCFVLLMLAPFTYASGWQTEWNGTYKLYSLPSSQSHHPLPRLVIRGNKIDAPSLGCSDVKITLDHPDEKNSEGLEFRVANIRNCSLAGDDILLRLNDTRGYQEFSGPIFMSRNNQSVKNPYIWFSKVLPPRKPSLPISWKQANPHLLSLWYGRYEALGAAFTDLNFNIHNGMITSPTCHDVRLTLLTLRDNEFRIKVGDVKGCALSHTIFLMRSSNMSPNGGVAGIRISNNSSLAGEGYWAKSPSS